MRRTQHHDDGFTLIELLVTMSLLGIIAAIALQSLHHQRQRAFQAAMATDLRNAVTAEMAYSAGNGGWTTRPTELATEGYRTSSGVTPVHVRLVGAAYVACVKHEAAAEWLVYDGARGTTSRSASDCV